MLANVYKPLNKEYLVSGRPSVFLAGSIDNGKAGDWALKLTAMLGDREIDILNPRRDDWNPNVTQSIDDPDFNAQVRWELLGLQASDIIAVFFEGNSLSPITLMELGLFASSGKVIVAAEPGFWRRGNIEIICDEFNIQLFDNLNDLGQEINNRLTNQFEV